MPIIFSDKQFEIIQDSFRELKCAVNKNKDKEHKSWESYLLRKLNDQLQNHQKN